MRRFRLFISLVLLGASLSATQTSALEESDSCETAWEDLSKQYVQGTPSPDYAALLLAWKNLEQACGKSPRYRARLALIYFYLDRPQEAKDAVATLSPEQAEREPLVELTQILADIGLLRGGSAHEDDLQAVEQRLRVYASKNPRDPVGIALLADVLNELGRYAAAIEAYEAVLKSIGTTARSVGVMRNLTITYEQAARHEDAYTLAGKALQFDRAGLTADLDFMCAAARAQASLGKMQGARDTLTLLANKQPEIREHPDFKAAVDFVKQKMRETPAE